MFLDFQDFKKGRKIKGSLYVKFCFFAENRYKIPAKTIRNEHVVGSSPIASSIEKSRLPGISSEAFFVEFSSKRVSM